MSGSERKWPRKTPFNPSIKDAREYYADYFEIPVDQVAATRDSNGDIVCVAMDGEKLEGSL